MLVSGRELIGQAVAQRRAIGSFNTYNLEITRAILRAAEAQKAPIFLAAGSGALDYAGFAPLSRAMLAAADEASVQVAVHLDHSPDIATVGRCVEAGFTSVMIDGSRLTLEENVALTRDAINSGRGATIEAELGGIAGDENSSGAQVPEIPMTDPEQAAAFVAETGIESLAVAIGNAHGFYSGEPMLDFERLRTLERTVPVPLVLHGASGISDDDIRRCIDLGVRKINVNTEIRFALFNSLEESLQRGVKGYDVVRLFEAAITAMQAAVEEKISLFRDR
jgi:fructose-bisphosphate aldolase, class II